MKSVVFSPGTDFMKDKSVEKLDSFFLSQKSNKARPMHSPAYFLRQPACLGHCSPLNEMEMRSWLLVVDKAYKDTLF